eukprot:TRINITY_DN3838_c0_g2_i4.p2 TRINITY_DN3838_c0_g2~~TRINITY_DN3838_c0_g2_i4.p2  ORF type:complete len:243 (-),score=44.69 TRINITY_DN3838_c0_g2_i4:131-859(-)
MCIRDRQSTWGLQIYCYKEMKIAVISLVLVALAAADRPVPSWPNAFNATLIRHTVKDDRQVWIKLFYDWNQVSSRYDTYNSYIDQKGDWSLNCTTIFASDNKIWYIFPDLQQCNIEEDFSLPTIHPNWPTTVGTEYSKDTLYRGVEAELWLVNDILQPGRKLQYYVRKDNIQIPLRNQNTVVSEFEYFDFIEGPQNPSLFEIPEYCVNRTNIKCPYERTKPKTEQNEDAEVYQPNLRRAREE